LPHLIWYWLEPGAAQKRYSQRLSIQLEQEAQYQGPQEFEGQGMLVMVGWGEMFVV
jgi:hypothetical protein